MEIILSRKGFDSSTGGVANPILPDGTMVSLPIPDPAAPRDYAAIRSGSHGLGSLVAQLTRGRMTGYERAHLDPDLNAGSVARPRGWRPMFGQTGAAQGHLNKMGVTTGDLFLFFGWFRETVLVNDRYRYKKKTPDQHILFGWLRIARMVDLNTTPPATWMQAHPHCFGNRGRHNMLYVARERLDLPGLPAHLPGAGLFRRFRPELVLTRPGKSRSHWRLPSWFHPEGRASCLSYHTQKSRWCRGEDGVHLKSAARGQDFVLNTRHYPEALDWIVALFEGL